MAAQRAAGSREAASRKRGTGHVRLRLAAWRDHECLSSSSHDIATVGVSVINDDGKAIVWFGLGEHVIHEK